MHRSLLQKFPVSCLVLIVEMIGSMLSVSFPFGEYSQDIFSYRTDKKKIEVDI